MRRYVAELGHYQPNQEWRSIAVSEPVMTPPAAPAAETTVQFATLPPAPAGLKPVPVTTAPAAAQVLQAPGPLVSQPQPAQAQLAATPNPAHAQPLPPAPSRQTDSQRQPAVPLPLPPPPPALPSLVRIVVPAEGAGQPSSRAQRAGCVGAPPVPGEWTPAQERALAEMIGMSLLRGGWVGSAEWLELIGRRAGQEIPSGEMALLDLGPGLPNVAGEIVREVPSSWSGEGLGPKGFWLTLNAELIIYGATQSGAQVVIGGRSIHLRSDGTFSCRFALPNGTYDLPVTAVATHGDARQVELRFFRHTTSRGEVGVHPQDPSLHVPPEAGGSGASP